MDIKPGLWKTTTTAEGGAPMPKLSCRAKEQAFSPFMNLFPGPDTPGGRLIPGCRQTIVKATDSRLEVKIECHSPTSQQTIWAMAKKQDSEHVKGTVMRRYEMNGRARDTRMKMTAEWIAADCGDVKP